MILSTDGQTDKVKPVYPPFNFVRARCGASVVRLKSDTHSAAVIAVSYVIL